MCYVVSFMKYLVALQNAEDRALLEQGAETLERTALAMHANGDGERSAGGRRIAGDDDTNNANNDDAPHQAMDED